MKKTAIFLATAALLLAEVRAERVHIVLQHLVGIFVYLEEAAAEVDGDVLFHTVVGLKVKLWSDVLQIADGRGKFGPGCVQPIQEALAFAAQRVVLTGRALRALLPLVGEQPIVLQSGEQGVERSLHHEQLGLLQLLDDVTRIRRAVLQEQQHAVLKHPLAHL